MSEILTALEKAIYKNKFWEAYRSFYKKLHEEDFDIDHLINLLPKIFVQTEKDAMSYQIYQAVNKFAEIQPNKGIELFHKILKIEDPKILSLIPDTLNGISKSNIEFDKFKEAVLLLEDESLELKKQGYIFLTTFTGDELILNNDFNSFIYDLIKIDIENNNNIYFNQIIKIFGKFLNIIPKAKENLIHLSNMDSPELLYEITVLLSYELKYTDDTETYKTLLFNLRKISPEHTGSIYLLNHMVFQKITEDNPELTVSFLKEWLLYDRNRVSQVIIFRKSFEKLHSKNKSYFKTLVTKWLNADDPIFHIAISKLIMETTHHKIKNINLDENYLAQLSFKDIQFIIAKIIGYIYFKELIRSSILSILKIKIDDIDCVNFIKAIFNEYIVFNYPSTIEYLEAEKKEASQKVQKVIDEIIEINNNYFENISNLDLIKEFNASDKRLKIYNSIYQKEFQSKQKEVTENQNSFLNMCKNIQLRTGKGMFSKFEGKYTEKTEMALFQYSSEFPRGEYIDAIGQEKIRAIYRNYKRKI